MGFDNKQSHIQLKDRNRKAQDLLEGIIAHKDDLGELGEKLERMLRISGIHPSWEPKPSPCSH